jgi:phosphatidylserine decarboxylase
VRIAHGGGIFIAGALGLFAAVFLIWWTGIIPLPVWLVLGTSICLFSFLFFFRDPEREPPPGLRAEVAVSPANGKVVEAKNNGNGPLLAVYLRLSDVHVVRMPLSCEVKEIVLKAGSHRRAGSEGASANARLVTECKTPWGDMAVSQVTGLLARRIVPYLTDHMKCERGERIGLIRFGSRVEVVFPRGYRLIAKKGSLVRAGVTPVAEPDRESIPPEVS